MEKYLGEQGMSSIQQHANLWCGFLNWNLTQVQANDTAQIIDYSRVKLTLFWMRNTEVSTLDHQATVFLVN